MHSTSTSNASPAEKQPFEQLSQEILIKITEYLDKNDRTNLSLTASGERDIVDIADLRSRQTETIRRTLIRRVSSALFLYPSRTLMKKIEFHISHSELSIQKLARFQHLQNRIITEDNITTADIENDLHQLINIAHIDKLFILTVMLWLADYMNDMHLVESLRGELISEILTQSNKIYTDTLMRSSLFYLIDFEGENANSIGLKYRYTPKENRFSITDIINLLSPKNQSYIYSPLLNKDRLELEVFCNLPLNQQTAVLIYQHNITLYSFSQYAKWLQLIAGTKDTTMADFWLSRAQKFLMERADAMLKFSNNVGDLVPYAKHFSIFDMTVTEKKLLKRRNKIRAYLENKDTRSMNQEYLWLLFLLEVPLTENDIHTLSLSTKILTAFCSINAYKLEPSDKTGEKEPINERKDKQQILWLLWGKLLTKIHRIIPFSQLDIRSISRALTQYIRTLAHHNPIYMEYLEDIFEFCYRNDIKFQNKAYITLTNTLTQAMDLTKHYCIGQLTVKCLSHMPLAYIQLFFEQWPAVITNYHRITIQNAHDFIMKPVLNRLSDIEKEKFINDLVIELNGCQNDTKRHELIYTLACLNSSLTQEHIMLCLKMGSDYFLMMDNHNSLFGLCILSGLSHYLTTEIIVTSLPKITKLLLDMHLNYSIYEKTAAGNNHPFKDDNSAIWHYLKTIGSTISTTIMHHSMSSKEAFSCVENILKLCFKSASFIPESPHFKELMNPLIKCLTLDQINTLCKSYQNHNEITSLFMPTRNSHFSHEQNKHHSVHLQQSLFKKVTTVSLIEALEKSKKSSFVV